MFLKD